jgi:hypothetical protein
MTFYLILLLEYFGAPSAWVAPAPPAGQQAPKAGSQHDQSERRSAHHGSANRGNTKRASEQPVDDISNGF